MTKVNVDKIEENYSEFAHLLELEPIYIQGGEDDIYGGFYVGPNRFIFQSLVDGSEVVFIREKANPALKHFTFECSKTLEE